MNKQRFMILILSGLAFMAGCSTDDRTQGDLMLMYQESEPGIEPYTSRILVTDGFLRFDDGVDQSDFTLYDRKKGIIYNVSRENRTITKLEPEKSQNKISEKLLLDARKLDDEDIPRVEGKIPVHYQLLVNNNICSDVFVVRGLHKNAVTALGEFRRTLAGVHLKNIIKTPEEMRDECFLAHNIVSPSRAMQFGFPVFQSDANGKKRMLMDYNRDFKSAQGLYSLPADYKTTLMRR